jgi:glycosyltransferase involved in cell wall biosynthesis
MIRRVRGQKVKRILIIEAQMKQYRLPFYARLHESLRAEGMQLRVAYSGPAQEELGKRDNCELPREYGLKVKGSWLLKKRMLYQPVLREIHSANLVISDLSNKLVLTHYLLLLSRMGIKRVAFWGHGENKQASSSFFLERYRKRTLHWVTWWFAYTAGAAEYVHRQGFPNSRITAVQNSVDTRQIQECLQRFDTNARAALRASLEIPPAAPVGIFVGTLQKIKSLPFLLEACLRIREKVDDFHLVVVGGGAEEEQIRQSGAQHAWMHFIGPKFEQEKARLLGIADLFLLPGAVGLAILDAFAAGLPLVTTSVPMHGPELEYFEQHGNGVMTACEVEAYADAAVRLFLNPQELRFLQDGARSTGQKYSIEAMAENFRNGIALCLAGEQRDGIRSAWRGEERTS